MPTPSDNDRKIPMRNPQPVKALTLIQPWASLIALGHKRIETRPWRTKYRGPLAIHAGATMPCRLGETIQLGDEWTVERDKSGLLLRGPIAWPYRLPTSSVVAVVDLFNIRPTDSPECAPGGEERPLGDYSPGRFAWYLNNLRPFRTPFHSVKGRLGLWDWTPPVDLDSVLRIPSPESGAA